MVSHDQLAPESMRVEQAQDVVLSHAEGMFDQMRKRYSESLRPGKEVNGEERFKVYEEIATIITDRDLPDVEVNKLIGKILDFEWYWKGRKVMRGFLEGRGLKNLADRWSPGDTSEAFDKTLMLFPQFEVVIKGFFSPFVDYHTETSEHGISRRPWLMRDLFLPEAVDFNQSEKQLIAQSWLAGYFIGGDKMVEDTFHSVSDENKQEQNQAISFMMKDFGVGCDQARDVAQSVVRQFSQEGRGWILPDIENFLKNVALFVKGELDWNSFTQQDLVRIFNYSRRVARSWLREAQESEDIRFRLLQRNELRENLVGWLTELWWDKGMKDMGWDKFKNHLNKMEETEFFEQLDTHLVKEAKVLGQRLGMNTKELGKLLTKVKSSKEITAEIDKGLKEQQEEKWAKERAEQEKERDQAQARYNQSLEQALAILETGGVRQE